MFRLPALAVVLCGLALAACGEVSRSPELPAADGVVSGVVRREGEPAPARVRLFLLEAGTGYERTWAPSAEVGLAGTLAVGEPLDTQEAGADGRYRFGPVAAGRYQVHAVHADGWQAVHTLDLPVSGAAETADLALVGGEHVLRGRATYADGRPFEGRVWVAPTRQRRGWRPLPAGSWPADVADDGTFEVRALEARGYVLHLHRPDALFAERHPTQVPHDEALEVVVDEGAVEVAGRVVSAPAGEPVPGAAVSIQGRGPNGRLVVRARTDAEGRFEVLGPPEERLIRVSADGFVPTQAKHASDSDFHARLQPLAVVRGRAVNHATGRPVAGVRMHVCPVGTGSRHARRGSVVTGEDGSYSLDRAPPGEVMLYATGSGWISAALLGPRDASQCPCAFTLHPGEVREMDVPVVPASRTTGRVLDAEGRPVSGVVVRANRVGRAATSSLFPPYRAVTATDEQGRFAFDDLVAGVAHRLVARPSGRAGTRSDVVYPSASLDVELRLPAPRWLDVRVVERATEAPVAGAKVTATRAVGTWSTDADGRARVGPLGAGKVSVWADHPEFVELGKRMLVPGAEEEGDPDPVVVALDRGQTMRGRAFLPDGRPQPNGTIRVESRGRLLAASIPSSDGAFVFSRLPAGTLDVIAQCTVEGRSFVGRSRVEAERGEVLVSLRDAGPARIPDVARAVLHVRVVDEAGRPVVGGNARLHGARAGVSRRLSQGGADLLRIALADETRVEVSGARSVDGTALAATLSGPVALSDEEVEIRLAAGGKVTGRVLDVDGMPVAGIHLFARVRPPKEAPENPIGGRHATALTDPDGSFVLEGLGEARYTLDWALPRRLRVAEAVLVEPGDRDVVVVLEKALAGTLTVVDDDGRPVPGAVVELRQMPRELPGGGFIGFGGRVPPPQTDEAGEHPFGPLDDRFDYSLRVEPPGDRSDLAVFEEEPWEPESGLVRLQKGLVLRGHVRLLGGRRIDELKVTCRPAGQRALEVKPGPDGSFAFENLPPGPATLGLRLDRVGMDTWSRRKEVRTGETDVVYEVDLGAPLRVEIANWPKGQREYLRFAVLLPESHLPENPSLRPHARLGRTMRFEGLDPDETYTLRVVGMDDGTCFVGRGIVPGPDVRRIRLVPGRTIRGQLLLPLGHEKPSVTASSGLDGVSGTVDERGTFEIRGLPDGEWRVKARASGPDGTWSMGEVFVQAGDEVGILLEEFDG